MLCISAAIAVMRCLSVRLSVCLSRSWIMSKRINISSKFSGSHTILVFPYQMGWRYSDRNLPNGGVESRWGISKKRDSGLIAGYRRLLDVRTTKWQKQLPTTMQCRSHSRRRTVECLFVMAFVWGPQPPLDLPVHRNTALFEFLAFDRILIALDYCVMISQRVQLFKIIALTNSHTH